MKNEIDLRPREFIQARRNPKHRLLAGIAAVTVAGAVLLCFALAERQSGRLSAKIALLRQSNQALTAEAAPLTQLEEKINALEEKAAIKASLQAKIQPWADNLCAIEAALPPHFTLNALTADSRGQLTLNGNGPAMPQIASYCQALERLDFIRVSAVSHIELEAAGGYRFVIQATLEEGSADTREGS